MKDQEFNLYMNKFKKRYFVKIDEDKVRVIESRLGKIAPYCSEKQLLGVWCINLTPRKKTSILKQLLPHLIEVHQNCDCEFGAYFHEKELDAVCKIIKARQKRQLTDEQRKLLVERAKLNFNKSVQQKDSSSTPLTRARFGVRRGEL